MCDCGKKASNFIEGRTPLDWIHTDDHTSREGYHNMVAGATGLMGSFTPQNVMLPKNDGPKPTLSPSTLAETNRNATEENETVAPKPFPKVAMAIGIVAFLGVFIYFVKKSD